MKTLKEFINKSLLNEHYVNILPHDEELRKKHLPELHDMLHKAYASEGGMKGSGFSSVEDMHKNIPMIKFNRQDGKINAAAFYKDKHGRKRVAMATDQTPEGKTAMGKIMKSDLEQHRSYGEMSKKALSFLHKHLHADDIKSMAIHPDKIRELSKGEEIRPVSHDDPEVERHPHLKDHFYQRKIGDHFETKVALGTLGKRIK